MHILNNRPPLIGFAAWSGTGKTTLLEQLIPLLRNQGLQIGVIKHAHHDFDIDHEGKDSYKLRKAGAVDTIVASGKRWALIHENDSLDNGYNKPEPDLWELVDVLKNHSLDMILIEGFKHESFPRIEVHRRELNKPLLYPDDKEIIAIATDSGDEITHPIKILDINKPAEIVTFILQHLSLQPE